MFILSNMGKDQEFIEAARNGNITTVEKILNQKAKRSGPLASLRRGPGANVQDSSGYSALHHAALNGHTDIVRLLLAHDASPNLPDSRGSSPLHLAAWAGHQDIVKLFLTLSNKPANPNLQTIEHETPLHYAAQHGHTGALTTLLAHGADPNIMNRRNETPLDLAAQYGRLQVVQMLIRAHPELLSPFRVENTTTSTTTFDLLNSGGSCSRSGSGSGNLLNSCSINNSNNSINCSSSNNSNHHNSGNSSISSSCNNKTIVFDHTPLHLASRNGHKNVVEVLLAAGVNVNVLTPSGTSLHEAALCGKDTIVRLLLDSGADLDATDCEGRTALDILEEFPPHVTKGIVSVINNHRNSMVYDSESDDVRDGHNHHHHHHHKNYNITPMSLGSSYENNRDGLSPLQNYVNSQCEFTGSPSSSMGSLGPPSPLVNKSKTSIGDLPELYITMTPIKQRKPTAPKKPPRRYLSVSPIHLQNHNNNSVNGGGEGSSNNSGNLKEGQHYQQQHLQRNKNAYEYICMARTGKKTEDLNNRSYSVDQYVEMNLPKPPPRNIMINSYENVQLKSYNPNRKLKRNRNTYESFNMAFNKDKDTNFLKNNGYPQSPTNYQQPPTPEHPPPSASQAENLIFNRIRPLSQEYKRRSLGLQQCSMVETSTSPPPQEYIFLSLYDSNGSLSSSASVVSDRSVSTDCVEEYIGDVPFAGLFKGSTINLDNSSYYQQQYYQQQYGTIDYNSYEKEKHYHRDNEGGKIHHYQYQQQPQDSSQKRKQLKDEGRTRYHSVGDELEYNRTSPLSPLSQINNINNYQQNQQRQQQYPNQKKYDNQSKYGNYHSSSEHHHQMQQQFSTVRANSNDNNYNVDNNDTNNDSNINVENSRSTKNQFVNEHRESLRKQLQNDFKAYLSKVTAKKGLKIRSTNSNNAPIVNSQQQKQIQKHNDNLLQQEQQEQRQQHQQKQQQQQKQKQEQQQQQLQQQPQQQQTIKNDGECKNNYHPSNELKVKSMNNIKELHSPFDEEEAWAKISEIMESFGNSDDSNNLRDEIDDNNDENDKENYDDDNIIQKDPKLFKFLKNISLEKYEILLIKNGFDDIQFLNGILDESDLITMNIPKEDHKKILDNIKILPIPPQSSPILHNDNNNTILNVDQWLESINLIEYANIFKQHLYTNMEGVCRVWEVELQTVLEISKLGHRKRILYSVSSNRATNIIVAPSKIATTTISSSSYNDENNDLNTLKANIMELRDESKDNNKLILEKSLDQQQSIMKLNNTAAINNDNKISSGVIRHNIKKNRLAPKPPIRNGSCGATIEIRAPSELLLGLPSNLQTQWRHPANNLINDSVTYDAYYLGSTVVKELRGTESTRKSIQKLKKDDRLSTSPTPLSTTNASISNNKQQQQQQQQLLTANNLGQQRTHQQQQINKKQPVRLSISYRGVEFIDIETQKTICEHAIRNINCACQDADDLSHFAYITKDSDINSHYCHVFNVDSMDLATEIILTLGQAFEVAYQIALRDTTNSFKSTFLSKDCKNLSNISN